MSDDDIKYPDVEVRLTGGDGNAFVVIGAVSKALRRAGHGDQVAQFRQEATAGDYDNVLRTAMRWVQVS